jgi:hypothetical protein
MYLAAGCHMRRVKEMCASFERGELVMQMALVNDDDGRALVGRMQGRMARAALELLGIGPDGGPVAACPEGQVG